MRRPERCATRSGSLLSEPGQGAYLGKDVSKTDDARGHSNSAIHRMPSRRPEQRAPRDQAGLPPPHYRWNRTSIVIDITCFEGALALASVTSVLPAFVRRLTDSAVLVGLVGTVFTAFQLLPQLPMGQLVKDKPRKKPYVLAALVGRINLLLTPVALWAGLASHPKAMLVLFFVSLVVGRTLRRCASGLLGRGIDADA